MYVATHVPLHPPHSLSCVSFSNLVWVPQDVGDIHANETRCLPDCQLQEVSYAGGKAAQHGEEDDYLGS